jgi:hypothetical protein
LAKIRAWNDEKITKEWDGSTSQQLKSIRNLVIFLQKEFNLNDKTCININALLIKQVEKVKIFILLLTIGTLIPAVTNANNRDVIKVLSIKKVLEVDNSDYLKDLCNKWKLDKKEIIHFFATAEKDINSAQINSFDIYPCEIKGELLINGINKKYSINLGGLGFFYGKNIKQIVFGCSKGECLRYVHYEPDM